ncbi:oxidoreductase [Mycoplasmopsis canis PG 14]|uniref:Limonene 1,2-monooxygenase n=2 Tax=Mycoplasmopsis canis TaxID=29555 RepID=A0A0F6ZP96_9BACT|nr:LLM class flavin-dependent oxidoreductase [Mycoplasmopsis canis]AKF40904.1 luciferase [Mycoplasmopsis canis]AMD81015.1 luciferase [Mycoplasmopsis canis PG 14]EIE40990.1 oxidoreductase [Mycoplasmopsis canis PG 14]VEU68826.1 Limonene 1,2-monooxygenase [Mycoplasmopsis canis]
MKKIELGISTFGETTILEKTGKAISHDERIRNMIEEVELADKVGLDIYAVGEHHREDFAISSPEMMLAAGAVNTKKIKLTSAVTVLSSNDPVRVYQNFAHVDALSNGRAEIMVGRGSFIESFPLFGYDLKDYEQLFTEKLDMLLHIKDNEIVTWKGKLTQSIDAKGVYPRAIDLPIWVATGGNIHSTINIALKGLPIVYAVIGGNPYAFKPLVNAYKQVGKEAGHSEDKLKVGAHSWGYIAETTEKAKNDFFWPTKQLVDNIARTRESWTEMDRRSYEYMVSDQGAMIVGDPKLVAKKIIKLVEELQLDRFMLHLPTGSVPHEDLLKAIKLYGEEVAPIVREYFANK